MCFRTPKEPAYTSPPKRDATQDAVRKERKVLADQQGVYGNIFTSALGDSGYNTNTQRQNVASLGASA